jgi:hypothetical protein
MLLKFVRVEMKIWKTWNSNLVIAYLLQGNGIFFHSDC